ncbi:MAG: fasciclin domain-containing protein [Caulobacteraceae bacterium]|nr:fasciclin domain-containing protein [Caulobacteraceae bacterium]
MKSLLLTVAAVALVSGVAAAQTPAPAAPVAAPAAADAPKPIPPAANLTPSGDIVDTLKASAQFSILSKALDGSGLAPLLKRPGPFTLIAPTDAAFNALPPAQLADLLNPDHAAQLQALLIYHLINTAVPPSKIEGTKGAVQTVARKDVQIDASAAPAKFNDANVEGVATVSNGFIYVVDKVLGDTPAAPAAPAAAPAAPGH